MTTQDQLDEAAGAALKAARVQSGRSQEDLADEVSMDQSRLSKVERLGPAIVPWKVFCSVAHALGYDVEVVLRPR